MNRLSVVLISILEILLVIWAAPVAAQTTAHPIAAALRSAIPDPVRDPNAVAAVRRAIASLGGQAALAQLNQASVTGSTIATEGSMIDSGSFVWKYNAGEFRSEITTEAGSTVFVSGHGSPAYSRRGQVVALPKDIGKSRFPLHLPGIQFVKYLSNPSASIQFMDQESIGSEPVVRVRLSLISDPNGIGIHPQEWLFDESSGLPVRLEYWIVLPIKNHPKLKYSVDLSDYRKTSGILVPFLIQTSLDGRPEGKFQIESVNLDQVPAPEEFDLSTQGGLR